jgi:hypothetical protein
MKNPVFWDITLYIPVKSTEVSEEHLPFIFTVEE